jgi:hypothetical protein
MKKPTNLADITNELCEAYSIVMADRRTAVQVKEGSNALGKAISASKVHLESCKLSKTGPAGWWKKFIMDDAKPDAPARAKAKT